MKDLDDVTWGKSTQTLRLSTDSTWQDPKPAQFTDLLIYRHVYAPALTNASAQTHAHDTVNADYDTANMKTTDSPHCNIRLEPFHVVFNVYDNSVEKGHTCCCCCKTNCHYRSNMVPKRANIRLCQRNFICLCQTSHKTGAGLVILWRDVVKMGSACHLMVF